MSNPSFGRRLDAATTTDAIRELERSEGRSERFARLDALLGDVLVRSMRGEQLVALKQVKDQDSVTLTELQSAQRRLVNQTYALEAQQGCGAWFIPESASLRIGWIDLPFAMQRHGQFASGLACEQRAKLDLAHNTDALALWALLEPLADALYLPFALRGPQAGTKSREDAAKLWAECGALFDAIGVQVEGELAALRPGGDWSRLQAAEQHAAKQRLMEALARQLTPETAARYRAFRVSALVSQYYRKAKADGRAKRTQVLTKALERSLSAFFGGDWLAFLDYLGEEPHQEEQVVTQLPQTRLYVGTSSRAAELAAQQGLPVEEVERVLASFWQQPTAASPVEQRVAVLRRYWDVFDTVHARQAPGMPSLWGFVEERTVAASFTETNGAYPQAFLYRRLLPPDLVEDIDRLWGRRMLARHPELVISEPYPNAAMADALGAALRFWHGAALTAWFVCEGPSSRTDMAGLAHYHRRDLNALAGAQMPVDGRMFEELVAAEQRLGAPQSLNQETSRHDVGLGISITTTYSFGSRRDGFERLRDIITRYRRAWAQQYIDAYLRAQWETPLRASGDAYNKLLHDKGKPPTMRQTAKFAEAVTNSWFGGDLHAFYGAIGEKAPARTQQRLRLPASRQNFVQTVFACLGGKRPESRPGVAGAAGYEAYQAQVRQQWDVARLTELSLTYVQLYEVLDRPPTLEELGARAFEVLHSVLSDDVAEAWRRFSEAVEGALHGDVTKQEEPPASVLSLADGENTARTQVKLPPQRTHAGQAESAPQPPDAVLHPEPRPEPVASTFSTPGATSEQLPTAQPVQKKRSLLDWLFRRK